MGLLHDARELTDRKSRCPVALLDDDGLQAEIDETLDLSDGRTLTVKAISQALAKRGVRINEQSLRRHKRGDCSCEPR